MRSPSDILRDGRDTKSGLRAYGNRLGSPNKAADFVVEGRNERDQRRRTGRYDVTEPLSAAVGYHGAYGLFH